MRIVILIIVVFSFSICAQASELPFGPSDANIKISVKYAALGKYMATFDKYQGILDYDANERAVTSVFLKIEAATVRSGFNFNDGIVRSPLILDVKKFPFLIFQSNKISKLSDRSIVDGILQIHGVKKSLQFPFYDKLIKGSNGKNMLEYSGKWVVARKEFGITWNKLLDQGGIVVGNYITVEWEVRVPYQ